MRVSFPDTAPSFLCYRPRPPTDSQRSAATSEPLTHAPPVPPLPAVHSLKERVKDNSDEADVTLVHDKLLVL